MIGEELPGKNVQFFFVDNTYTNLRINAETSVSDVIASLCRKQSLDPSLHELCIMAPGSQTSNETCLKPEDKPWEIQSKGGTAFKFLLRKSQQPQIEESSSATTSTQPSGDSPDTNSPARIGAGTFGGASSSEIAAAEASGKLKMGTLERLLEDERWHNCMVILDEDRLWYSQYVASSGENAGHGKYGGGMVFLRLCDCDKVMEGDDKKLMQLMTKEGTMTLRARNGQERNAWLLAIVKQAALVKERDILLQAERIITGMECRRASQHLAKLDNLSTLNGVLEMKEARDLFLEFAQFARNDQEAAFAKVPLSVESFLDATQESVLTSFSQSLTDDTKENTTEVKRWWTENITIESLTSCLERYEASDQSCQNDEDRKLLLFIEEELFPRFKEHPEVQCRLCWIAAGIT